MNHPSASKTGPQLLDELYTSFHLPIQERQAYVFEASKMKTDPVSPTLKKRKTEDVLYVGASKANKRSVVSRYTII